MKVLRHLSNINHFKSLKVFRKEILDLINKWLELNEDWSEKNILLNYLENLSSDGLSTSLENNFNLKIILNELVRHFCIL
jgi:hypothetical protein